MTGDHDDEAKAAVREGRWNPVARQRAATLGQSATWSDLPRRAYSLVAGGATLATARNLGHRRWQLTIEGYEFVVTAESGTARFWDVPGGRQAHASVAAFSSSVGAMAAANRIIRDAARTLQGGAGEAAG